MDYTFFAWYKSSSCSFKVKCVFMPDNDPSHVSKLYHEFFPHKKIMKRPPSNPNLNPIIYLGSIVKVKLYKGTIYQPLRSGRI